MTDARYVRNFTEFRKWLAENFAVAWKTATEEEISRVFLLGERIEFPARVWIEYVKDWDWGPQPRKVRFMTKREFYS